MSTIQELGAFLARETAAAGAQAPELPGPPSGTTKPDIHTNGNAEPAHAT
jgi:hypothetical protein